MMKLSIIILLIILNFNAFCQENEEIIDPISTPCFHLINENKIEPIILNGNYFGKIIIGASCDTVRLKLIDFKIIFAKLYSSVDSRDSIEIRLENKQGNYKFLDDNMAEILENIAQIEIEKADADCDYIPNFNIPIEIESEK